MSGSIPLRVLVLGSTGSIGEAALDVVRLDTGRFRVVGIAAGTSGARLAEQVAEFGPECAGILEEGLEDYRRHTRAGRTELLIGRDGIAELTRRCRPDVVLVGISGVAALRPVLEAIGSAKRVALANKECLVAGGALVMDVARRSGCEILPVDSEHSAAFQLLRGLQPGEVRRLVLTASGGPFRGWSEDRLSSVTREQAVTHPVWDMGAKISVDSGTALNKALELVEAHWLFGLPEDRVEIVVHPQSVVHALVECVDGALLAHLGEPDMRMPIQYALSWPARADARRTPLDLVRRGRLEFEAPDARMMRALALGRRAIRDGGSAGAVLNAANEFAVERFLSGNLAFTSVLPLVEKVYDRVPKRPVADLSDVLLADAEARQEALRCLPSSTR